MQTSLSPNFAESDVVTERLGEAKTFVNDGDNGLQMNETDGINPSTDIETTEEIECEICFQIIGADVANDDSIVIRIHHGGGALNTYSQTATITVVKAAPDTFDTELFKRKPNPLLRM